MNPNLSPYIYLYFTKEVRMLSLINNVKLQLKKIHKKHIKIRVLCGTLSVNEYFPSLFTSGCYWLIIK